MRPSASSPRGSTAVQDVETVALAEADGRILARDISAPLPLPPFTNSAVDGYAVRSGDLPQDEEQAFPVTGRVQAGASAQASRSSPASRCGFSPARRCPRAPTPCSCRRTCGSRGRQGRSAGGLEARRQCASRGRGYCRRAFRAGGRPAPAAAGCRARRRVRPDPARGDQAHPRRGVFHRQRTGVAGRAAARPAQLFDSNRFMLMAMLRAARLRGQRSRHPARRSRLARAGP